MYANAAAVLEYVAGVDLSALGDQAAQDAAVQEAAEIATAAVDAFTRRTFSTEVATKLLDGSGSPLLFVPDLLSLTSWSMDGVARSTSELLLCPDSTPKIWLRLTSGVFTVGSENVELSGTWGYGQSVPILVARATARLAAAELLGRVAISRDRGSSATSQGALSERYDGGAYAAAVGRLTMDAQRELAPFRRPVLP